MKKKTFFYKFDKDKETVPATTHPYGDQEEGKKIVKKLDGLIEKKSMFDFMIDSQLETIEWYYEERIWKKIDYIKKNDYLSEYTSYIEKPKKFIYTLNFNKVLNEFEINSFLEKFSSELVRVSIFDTQIEIVTDNKTQILKDLKKAFSNEVDFLTEMLSTWEIYEEYDSTTLSIESVWIDIFNRNKLKSQLENLTEELTTAELVFSNSYILDKDLAILARLYKKNKNDLSSLEGYDLHTFINNRDDSPDKSIKFFNIGKEFYEWAAILLDGLIKIEVLNTIPEDIDEWDLFDVKLWVMWETVNTHDLVKVCVVDSKIEDNLFTNWYITYWTVWNSKAQNSPHWTQVSLLAMYWKVDDSLILGEPCCSVYNIITIVDSFAHIEKILEEAINKNCKIVNISLWPQDSFLLDNETISRTARRIDSFLVNKDLLVILSCWNIKPSKTSIDDLDSEDANINYPKDSISSICIWGLSTDNSVALYSRKNNICSKNNIWNREWWWIRLRDTKKPDLLDWGDNIVYWVNKWRKWLWTSFAAPLMTNKAAKILNVYGDISTNTVKCLLMNYSKNEINSRTYDNNETYLRHSWRWIVKIDSLIDDNIDTLNIVIEDYISSWKQKEYKINLPNIQDNWKIIIKRSVSYNPPVSNTYHLRYSKFCVSSKIVSDTYIKKWKSFFSDEMKSEYTDKEIKKLFDEWKKEKWNGWNDKRYERPVTWINYFGSDNFWAANYNKENILNKEYYNEMIDGFKLLINGHSRFNLIHNQKFSLVMTIDISDIQDKQSYIEEFSDLNNSILIKWIETQDIITNIQEKNQVFDTINNDLEIDIEELNIFDT